MAETGIKICKYCGKEYPACKTVFKPGVFRWRDVACCEEHGAKYLEQVLAARNESAESHDNNSVAFIESEVDEGGEIANEDAENDAPAAPKKKGRKKVVAEEPEFEEN